jgi:hypothetical protein
LIGCLNIPAFLAIFPRDRQRAEQAAAPLRLALSLSPYSAI